VIAFLADSTRQLILE